MQNNTIPITIEALSPVHIGSGNELQGNFEYVHFQEEELIAVIDPNKILEVIGTENIDQWVALIENRGNLLNDLPQLRTVTSSDVAKRTISILDKSPNPEKNNIKEQTHLGNQAPTIPGSSLKGAIRTAILTKAIRENPDFTSDQRNLKNRKRRFSDENVITEFLGKDERYDRRNNNTFSKYSANKDIMRFLRVSDFYFDKETTVVKNTVINLFDSGWDEKKRESAYWECIPKGAITTGSIQVPQDLLREVQNKRYITQADRDLMIFNIKRFGLKKIFKIINDHTARLLDKELIFWNEEDNPIAIGKYMDYLEEIEEVLKDCDDNSCVIRVGASNGWEFMTGGWLSGKDVYGDFILSDKTYGELINSLRKKNYPEDMVFPKTRKMIEGGMPLGFVKLTVKK